MPEKPQEFVVDIRGQICPSTLLTALKEINDHRDDIRSGEVKIIVLTTNRNATSTIPNAAENMGYKVNVERENSHYRIEIGAE
ncbi:MAG: sulfurtransferase TusA family protein [Deltaproteobacteria bacterium]|nr:MAG: sulfurtransferase TusA family protein [Deltaproteobacteria bacterium]